jgi:hypothetical protein
MQMLEMEGTSRTPAVRLDPKEGRLEISGRALVDDARTFFKPVLDWVKEYVKSPQPATHITFKFEYLNNESSKVLLDIIGLISGLPGARVHWYFHEDDEDMEETGEELAELVTIPFEFIAY